MDAADLKQWRIEIETFLVNVRDELHLLVASLDEADLLPPAASSTAEIAVAAEAEPHAAASSDSTDRLNQLRQQLSRRLQERELLGPPPQAPEENPM
jgi:hypothetical protein